jgi:chromosome segregation ATPase
MGQDIKKLIDSIDDQYNSVAELKKVIAKLQNKNLHLRLRIKELEELVEDQRNQLAHTKQILPSDISVLKDIIHSKNEEIREKDKQIETLKKLTTKFTDDLEQTQLKQKALEFKLIDIPGIGIKTSSMLRKSGINDISDLINCDIEELARTTKGLGITRLQDWKNYLMKRNEKLGNL